MKKTSSPSARKKAQPRKRVAKNPTQNLPDFNELIENAGHGILVHSNFKPLYANQAFARLFGYKTAKDILAMPIIRPLVPPDRWARIEEEYDDLIRGRRKPSLLRVRGIRKDKK